MRNFYYLIFLVLISQNVIAQDFYSLKDIQEIRIEFPTNNWDAKLDSLHSVDVDLRLLATSISLNGQKLDSVGVKYKGNSTYRPTNAKNPLNIKLDYVKDQSYKGVKSIKLSNGFMDPSMLREILGYQISGQYMPASKANFAVVYFNNVYQGVFTNVESTDKDFLESNFDSGNGAYFQCDRIDKQIQLPTGCPPMGSGSALKWVSNDSLCYKNSYEIESDNGWTELLRLIQVLDKNPGSIDSILDVDRALWMLAFNNFYVNLDSYSGSGHNYLIYQDENKRFNTILWDLNECYGAFTNSGTGQLNLQQMIAMSPVLHATNAERPLINKIISQPVWRKRYIAHLRTIMDESVSKNYYSTLGKELQDLVKSFVQLDNNKFYDYSSFISNLNTDYQINAPNGKTYPGLTSFSQRRADYLKSSVELSGITPQFLDQNAKLKASTPQVIVQFVTQVSNSTNVWLYYREDKNKIFRRVSMFDDGNHNDQSAGDGIFGLELVIPKTLSIQYYYLAENNNHARLLPERAEYEYLKINTTQQEIFSGELLINELMSSNTKTIQDESGEYDDWIELYNNSSKDISLYGYFLTDDINKLDKWVIPDTVIKAGNFLLIWADEDGSDSGLHTNFKLSKSGEFLALSGIESIIDSISFGVLQSDNSFGRCNNNFVEFHNPTPSLTNDCISNSIDNEHLNFNIYPVPSTNYLVVELMDKNTKEVNLKLYSSSGIEIQRSIDHSNSMLRLNLDDLANGLYMLQIQVKSQIIQRKILKIGS